MDATEDRDLKLQRASGDLIGELTASLPALLRHPHTQHGNDRGTVRKFVWWTTLRDLVKLVNHPLAMLVICPDLEAPVA